MRTSDEVGKSVGDIVEAMNSISVEEIDSALQSISRETALGPMLDPTAWLGGARFDAASQTKKVLEAIRDFKTQVSGIGDFTKVT